MIYIKADENKNLSIDSQYTVYEGESLSENIQISVPDIVADKDISGCTVWLCYINAFGQYNEVDLRDKLIPSENGERVFEDDVTNVFTVAPGEMQIWLEFKNTQTGFNMKTEFCSYVIYKHINPDEFIPEQTFTLLEQFIKKYEQLLAQGGINPDGSPIDTSNFVTKEMLMLYALKATSLAGYGITDGVTSETFQGFVKNLSETLAMLSEGISNGDTNTLESANVYTNNRINEVGIEILNQAKDYANEVAGSAGGSVDLSNYYTKEEVDEICGDIETALDEIIAIQNTLIGGVSE